MSTSPEVAVFAILTIPLPFVTVNVSVFPSVYVIVYVSVSTDVPVLVIDTIPMPLRFPSFDHVSVPTHFHRSQVFVLMYRESSKNPVDELDADVTAVPADITTSDTSLIFFIAS